MKSNETSFRRSRAPRPVYQTSHKLAGKDTPVHANGELSARGQRRKQAAEERRLQRKQKRQKAKAGNGADLDSSAVSEADKS